MTLPQNKKIILFDGVCNLCDAFVQLVIKRDKNDIFRFVPLQSAAGMEIVSHIGVDASKIDSVILYEPGVAYYCKSDAALGIVGHFGGFWTLAAAFKILPRPVRDFLYDFVARNRYKWYGKKESCMIPTPEIKAKFIA